jgi:hypothetical protein
MSGFEYKLLPPGLQPTADAAIEWFVNEWGIKKSRVEVEAAFDSDINLRPTFVVPLDDGNLLCIEVSSNIYSNTLDSVVLRCRDKGLPVKLVVAAPKDVNDGEYSKKIKDAKRAGVGVLEVDSDSGQFVQSPLSLSLTGVRPLQLAEFPPRYRQALQHAHQMFRDGEPSKACSLVYDELERLCRALAKKVVQKGLWKPGKLKLDISPWASVMSSMDQGIDRSDPLAKKVTSSLVARVIGVTGHRNESGHAPKNLKERTKRDHALRTRFESGVDLLHEVIEATKGFRL